MCNTTLVKNHAVDSMINVYFITLNPTLFIRKKSAKFSNYLFNIPFSKIRCSLYERLYEKKSPNRWAR